MKKIAAFFLLTTVLCFSYGVRPAFDLGVSWSYVKPQNYDGSHLLNIGLGITAPFSRYVGLDANFGWLCFGLDESGTIIGLGGDFGFIEMIPGRVASPYFTQQIILSHISSGGISGTDFGFSVGVGVEFVSSYYVSPYLGGNFAFLTSSFEGYSDHSIGINAGIGVRFSLK